MSDNFDDTLMPYLREEDENTFDSELSAINPSIDQCSTSSRFVSVSSEQLDDLLNKRIPETTQAKVNWAMKLLNDWLKIWKTNLNDGCLKVFKEVDEMNKSDLNHCLKYFLPSIRKINGEDYPPRTLKEIVACVQHHLNYKLKKPWSIFKDEAFMEARETLDAVMKESARKGNVKQRKRAAPIALSTESDLWRKGVFGSGSPRQLIDTLIYHFGLHFALRARQEHRNLKYGNDSQISLHRDENGIERLKYVENFSKNKNFGITSSRQEPKVTYIFPHEDRNKCIIELYKCYLSHRPESNGMPGNNAFYLTPMDNPKNNVWYKNLPMGIHTISGTLSRLMNGMPSDDETFYSNTSLRRTAKTRLVMAGISKEISARKTGHTSNADLTYVDASECEVAMTKAIFGTKSIETVAPQAISADQHCSTITSDSSNKNTSDSQHASTPKHVKITCGSFNFEASF